MNYRFCWSLQIFTIVGLCCLGLSACESAPAHNSLSSAQSSGVQVKVAGFKRLAAIREEKKQEVMAYFSAIKEKIHKVGQDDELRQIFLQAKKAPKKYETYRFEEKYVVDYGEFYDLLLIDETGLVFESLRKESDYKKNILTSKLLLDEGIELSQHDVTFIDYKFYAPSRESAAFFIVPVIDDGMFAGWLAFQLPINKFNWILTDRQELGRTGEVYLVNQEHVLMTESRFLNENSALKLRVETDAVKNALQFDKGEGIIQDYRGVRVFSSFEKFEQLGATWIIIAEIDEAEVLTEAFLRSDPAVLTKMAALAAALVSPAGLPKAGGADDRIVDIGEFKRSAGRGQLLTYGVATCTAVGIQLPDRFAYLTHISPVDVIYSTNPTSGQNLLAQLLSRITYFELLPAEKRDVQLFLVAPHTASFPGAVHTILSQGFDLKNIRLSHNPQARGANIAFQPFGQFQVEWYGDRPSVMQNISDFPALQDLYAQVIGY